MENDVYENILNKKLVAILRGLNYEDNFRVIELLIECGFNNIEVTMNTENALKIIDLSRKKYDKLSYIGAGTVKNEIDAKNSIDAGAQFLLSPNLSVKAIEYANSKNILIVPGVFTPTEIVNASVLGCRLVKLFPAGNVGYNYIKSIKGPLDDIKIMAVGGIDVNNVSDYLSNGTDAVGVGGKLIINDLVKNGDLNSLKQHILRFKKQIEINRSL